MNAAFAEPSSQATFDVVLDGPGGVVVHFVGRLRSVAVFERH
jgi:hypothetical protein